jgi:hypothetical protein
MDTKALLDELRQQIRSNSMTMPETEVKTVLYQLINQAGTEYHDVTCIKCHEVRTVRHSEFVRLSDTIYGLDHHICVGCKAEMRAIRRSARLARRAEAGA